MRTGATLLCLLLTLGGCTDREYAPCTRVHAFYYGWYGNPAVDGAYRHWNHPVLDRRGRPDSTRAAYPGYAGDAGGDPGYADIGADFYPELGPYSSNEALILDRHMAMLVQAGIGVLVASWWGPGSFEDRNLPLVMDAADRQGLKVAIHFEPFPGRDAVTAGEALRYLVATYGQHPALWRPRAFGGRPVVYVYDSYLTSAQEWARLLRPDGDLSIRGTPADAVMIGLWVGRDEGSFFCDGGFDGFYTYFAAAGFTWGATPGNWPALADFAAAHGLIFVPCVGPGYRDARVRPWNTATTRDRENGRTYDRMFGAAIAAKPLWIGVTSLNEWHEGTQIEPATPMACDSFTYEDYGPHRPDWYLDRTRHWIRRWQSGPRG